MKTVKIYTDGACSGNPGPGGWAAVLIFDKNEKEISGFDAATTNNRMELLAAIRGLETLKNTMGYRVELYSDSSYLVNAMNKGWLNKWKTNNWKTADKKAVKNVDLWTVLDKLNDTHNPKYFWVKGHAENPYNNRCDELAVGEIQGKRISAISLLHNKSSV
jgi:ribonuclease HI